jgi:hypothetical protein
MPNVIIKSFAKKTDKSEKEVERLWDKSKKIVADQYDNVDPDSDQFYALTTGILKKMLSIKESKFDNIVYTILEKVDNGEDPVKVPSNYLKLKGLKKQLLEMKVLNRLIYLRTKLNNAIKFRDPKMPKAVLKTGDAIMKDLEAEIEELDKIKNEIGNLK